MKSAVVNTDQMRKETGANGAAKRSPPGCVEGGEHPVWVSDNGLPPAHYYPFKVMGIGSSAFTRSDRLKPELQTPGPPEGGTPNTFHARRHPHYMTCRLGNNDSLRA